MVTLRQSDQRGIEAKDETTAPRTGGQSIIFFDIRIEFDAEEAAFHKLATEGFAEDWESDADSIYDNFLEDADLQ